MVKLPQRDPTEDPDGVVDQLDSVAEIAREPLRITTSDMKPVDVQADVTDWRA